MAMVVSNVNNDLGKKIEKLVDVAVTYGKVGWASAVHQEAQTGRFTAAR